MIFLNDFKRKVKPLKVKEMEDFAELAKDAHSDVQGSYTGDPLYDEQPVQDADDL